MAATNNPWQRGEKLRAARDSKYDEAFTGKQFAIVREVHLPPGQAYQTQFGHRGRHGYILRDLTTSNEFVVGADLLQLIHDRYGAVDLPTTPLRRSDTRRD